jgi:hypothetical protein
MKLSEASEFYRNSAYLSMVLGIILIIRAFLFFEFSLIELFKSLVLPLLYFYITIKFYNRDGYRYTLSEALFFLLIILIPFLFFINLIQAIFAFILLEVLFDLILIMLGVTGFIYYVYY